jgi:hypothetical protein
MKLTATSHRGLPTAVGSHSVAPCAAAVFRYCLFYDRGLRLRNTNRCERFLARPGGAAKASSISRDLPRGHAFASAIAAAAALVVVLTYVSPPEAEAFGLLGRADDGASR